jgi:hypothetical protein
VSARDVVGKCVGARLRDPLGHVEASRILSALTAAGYVILPAEMTVEQAARSLDGSGLAQRLRVSSPETYAEMVERRRGTWREMVAVMGEGSDG